MNVNDKIQSKGFTTSGFTTPGFTTFELMMAVLILSILAALTLPAIGNYQEKRRAIGAAEEIYSQLQLARSEAIKQSIITYVNFSLTGSSPSSTWDIGTSATSGCDPIIGGAADCRISGAEKVIHSTSFNGVRMTTPTFASAETYFSPTRGTARAGTITLTTDSYDIRVVVSTLGRIRIYSPEGLNHISGYPIE